MSNQSQTARERIMARLKASGCHQMTVPQAPPPPTVTLDREARIERLSSQMTAIRTEIHTVAADDWVAALKALARERRWKTLLYGPEGPIGAAIKSAWSADLPALIAYDEPVETFKEQLFQIDAGITSVRSAVADTGAIVLWPTPQEPRLLSLVPPVHVAVLDANTIHNSMAEMMAAENWAGGMPTNALLISGPSKTADIEFTLVFGVHGPKELILLIRK
jgi:L-lactate dehydrogenase complex protein LldG